MLDNDGEGIPMVLFTIGGEQNIPIAKGATIALFKDQKPALDREVLTDTFVEKMMDEFDGNCESPMGTLLMWLAVIKAGIKYPGCWQQIWPVISKKKKIEVANGH
jgi:hypothetical protein